MSAQGEQGRPRETGWLKRKRHQTTFDVGTLIVAVGIGLFDYRMGICVLGGLLAGEGLYGMSKDARDTTRPRG